MEDDEPELAGEVELARLDRVAQIAPGERADASGDGSVGGRDVVPLQDCSVERDRRLGRDELLDVDVLLGDAARCADDAHAASPTGVKSRARVKSMIQFVSHVSPPSSENACSQRGVGVVTPDHVKRTRIGRPSNVSVALEDTRVAGEPADHRRVEQAPAAGCPPSRSTTARSSGS